MGDSKKHLHVKLNQFYATAICGNDILSSALYVSGIAILLAGVYAPIVLAVIGVVLFFYKSVYTEVVEALPVNGGAYNCLLNGTSKIIAAIAGITTFLSYIATSVISAKTAVEYLNTAVPINKFAQPVSSMIPLHITGVEMGTIVLMLVFAVLVINGLKDSAKVALGIFSFHVVTLIAFVGLGFVNYLQGHSYFHVNLLQTSSIIQKQGGLFMALYLGFAASLLGVSGFESSANFVEEQAPGVFRKTLRNMLVGVAIFNPLIALVILNIMPYDSIVQSKDYIMSDAATILGGQIFKYIIVTDAFLVLAGAVLTAYVGVSGLMSRMAADGCVPNFFSKMNLKGAYPRIVLSFFLLCSSILIVTGGDLLSLAGVYTIAFLSVMSLFALGNLILREGRTELKRTYRAPLLFVILAFLATFFGIIGNIRIDPKNLQFFEVYFIPAVLVVLSVIYQDEILRFALKLTPEKSQLHQFIKANFDDMTEGKFVIFIHHLERLYKILDYVYRNETGSYITLVHCKSDELKNDHTVAELEEILPVLKKSGVFPDFKIDIIDLDMHFGPQAVEHVSKKLKIRENRILIGSIHNYHPYDYAELGGVRIIF